MEQGAAEDTRNRFRDPARCILVTMERRQKSKFHCNGRRERMGAAKAPRLSRRSPMKYILVTFVLAVGCTHTTPNYLPALAVAAGVAEGDNSPTPAPEPEPSDVCETCNGLGYLGDTVIKTDCPDCETPWQSVVAESGCQCDCDEQLQTISKKLDRLIELLDQSPAATTPPEPVSPLDPSEDAPPVAAGPSYIDWVSLPEARKTGKPIWIHFTGANCRFCRLFEQRNEVDPRIIKASKDWACVKSSDEANLRRQYSIAMIPSNVFLQEGRPPLVSAGLGSPTMLLGNLTKGR